jgi:L-lactate dehydrogenase
VGLTHAFPCSQGLASNLAIVDTNKERVEGEVWDLQHGLAFAKPVNIVGGDDYDVSSGSDVVVITAGVRQRQGETRLELVGRNVDVMASIVPPVVAASPGATLLIVSNPVDIMTWVAWRLSGLPAGRVLGSGTSLDSARFRQLVADRLGVAPGSVHGYVVAEHGDTSVPLWSQLSVGGARLVDSNPGLGRPPSEGPDPDEWHRVHDKVVRAAYNIIQRKGYTSSAIGLTVAALVDCVLRDDRKVFPLSVRAGGHLGITKDVFLSLPSVLGANGVHSVVKLHMTEAEERRVRASADAIAGVQATIAAAVDRLAPKAPV